MIQKPFLPLCIAIAFMVSACGSSMTNQGMATLTPDFFTATLPATSTPEPAGTPVPLTATPTLPPAEGITTTQVNVRAEPSTTSAVLGLILPSTKVKVIGKEASGTWYQLAHAESPQGKGWVLATYVQVAAGVEIPVVQVGMTSGSNGSVLVIQQVNVRIGPGTQFDPVGILSPNDVVALTGKNSSGKWLQIEYAGGPEARGWINADFVQASGAETVPVIEESTSVIGTEVPANSSTPGSTFSPALEDGDSAEAPSVAVVFAPHGTRALQFSSDVSAPQGDGEDWVRFTPYGEHISIRLACTGSSALLVEISSAGTISDNDFACSKTQALAVQTGQEYSIRLSARADPGSSTHYTLKVEQLP